MGSFRAPATQYGAARRGEEGKPGARGAEANLSRYYCYSCYRLSSYNKRRSVAMYTRRHRVYIPHNVVYAIPYRKPGEKRERGRDVLRRVVWK